MVRVADFMECLYHDLRIEGLSNDIHVTTIQPFFINTFSQIGSFVKFGRCVTSLGRNKAGKDQFVVG